MQTTSAKSHQTANGPSRSVNGPAVEQIERMLTDLQGLVHLLAQDRENLQGLVNQLQQERDELRQTVAILKEKLQLYGPLLVQWSRDQVTPQEAEAILTKSAWVSFEEVMNELARN